MSQPIHIFIAYAREDASYLRELRIHLRILERTENIKIWYDGEILPGQKWNEEIENQLQRADIFLLLLSADFIDSDYAYGKEMEAALARHERGEAILIPIVARACAWDMTPLAALQAPVEGKALGSVTGPKRDDLYEGIVRAVAKSVAQKQEDHANKSRYFADEAAWKEALKLNSLFGFNRYLEQYPAGRHVTEAKNAIAAIERKAQEERESVERNAWRQAQQQNTITDYQAYLQAYPNGLFITNAKKAIQSIQQDQKRQAQNADRTAFEKAKAENTIPAYRTYLINFPNGNYIKEANKAIKRLEQLPVTKQRSNLFPILLVLGLIGLGVWGIPKIISSSNENTTTSSSSHEQPVDSILNETDTILYSVPEIITPTPPAGNPQEQAYQKAMNATKEEEKIRLLQVRVLKNYSKAKNELKKLEQAYWKKYTDELGKLPNDDKKLLAALNNYIQLFPKGSEIEKAKKAKDAMKSSTVTTEEERYFEEFVLKSSGIQKEAAYEAYKKNTPMGFTCPK